MRARIVCAAVKPYTYPYEANPHRARRSMCSRPRAGRAGEEPASRRVRTLGYSTRDRRRPRSRDGARLSGRSTVGGSRQRRSSRLGRSKPARRRPTEGAGPRAKQEARGVTTPRQPEQPRQFDVWWASLPEPVGRRPILLLSRSSAFSYLTRVLVVEVTTTIRGIPQEIPLGRREGLPRSCVANMDALRTMPTSCLAARAGRISVGRHVEVKRALGHALHWPELTAL
jgi:mRNA interferase MazF